MADYVVAAGAIGKYELALTANTESTVTFGGGAADPTSVNLGLVEVKQLSGASPVYFRMGVSPAAATVRGDDCWDVHPGTAVVVSAHAGGDTTVRLISAAAAVVSVSSGE